VSFALALLVVGVTGYLSLSYEVLWYRAVALITAGYAGSFGVLLGLFLLGLAAGALFARRLCRDERTPAAERAQRRALAQVLLLANVAGYAVIPALAHGARHVATAVLAALPLTLSAGAFGAALPLVSHLGVAPDDRAGQRLSFLYMANIVGSVAGTLSTGFVLLDVLSLPRLALALGVAGLALTGAVFASALPAGRRASAWLLAALAGGALVALSPRAFDRVHERLVLRQAFGPASRFVYLSENRHGVVGVTTDLRVYGGGAYDGVISTDLVDDRNAIWRGYALAAFHPRARRVLVIGLSAGAWSQALANMPGVEELVAVEINPGYLPLIARYPQVASLLRNPRVHIAIDDGRRWLARHPDERFDAIVQNTTYHWRAHITNLLSAEYLALLRAHLAPGGVLMYNTTWSREAQRTGATVFPHAFRMLNFMVVSDAPLAFDAARFRAALLAWRIDGRPVLDPALPAHRARLDALCALGETASLPGYVQYALEPRERVLARTAGARTITDDNVASEYGRLWP
jgi:spermidine synthase